LKEDVKPEREGNEKGGAKAGGGLRRFYYFFGGVNGTGNLKNVLSVANKGEQEKK